MGFYFNFELLSFSSFCVAPEATALVTIGLKNKIIHILDDVPKLLPDHDKTVKNIQDDSG